MIIPVYYDEAELDRLGYIEFANEYAIMEDYFQTFSDEQWDDLGETLSDYRERITGYFFDGRSIAVTFEENEDAESRITGIGSATWRNQDSKGIFIFN